MNSGLFNVLHNAPNYHHASPIDDRIYIYLDRFCGERRDGLRFTSMEAALVTGLAATGAFP